MPTVLAPRLTPASHGCVPDGGGRDGGGRDGGRCSRSPCGGKGSTPRAEDSSSALAQSEAVKVPPRGVFPGLR